MSLESPLSCTRYRFAIIIGVVKRNVGKKKGKGAHAEAPIELTVEDFAQVSERPAPMVPSLEEALLRRKFTRVPYVTVARMLAEDESWTEVVRIDDISRGGLGLRGLRELAVGDRVTVQWALPMTGEARLLAVTVRWVAASGGGYRMGLAFDALDEEVERAIARYVTLMTTFSLC